MITLQLPEPADQELSLNPKIDSYKGESMPDEARRPLRGRLFIGGPVYRQITASSTDDVELSRFLEQEAAESDFFLLHLTCTLRRDEEPFVEALVEIDLVTDDRAATPPIAWSMEPYKLGNQVEITRSVSLGPSLKIQGFGIDAKVERDSKIAREDLYLEALYELDSTPAWELYRTQSTPLEGLQRFHLVVRTKKGSVTAGTARVEAKVERKRFGVLPYTASLPDGPDPSSFELRPRQ